MSKSIPASLNELFAILKKIEATIAWRALERKERPGGITPMGVLFDDSLEDLDTLFARFMLMYVETRQRLHHPRLCGISTEACAAQQEQLDMMQAFLSSLLRAFPGRASCRI